MSDPGVDFLPAPRAAELAVARNNAVAAVVADHPDRFSALAAVSLQTTDDAIAEAARCLDDLGHVGVGLLSSTDGRYLGHPDLRPMLDELDRRGAWVFVHPTLPRDVPTYGVPNFLAEYPFDTTRTFVSLLISGVFQSHPSIRWQFAHGGGTLPMLAPRLQSVLPFAAAVKGPFGLPDGAEQLTAESLRQALALSTFDTALVAEPETLRAVADLAGADRLVFGSDWPFAALMYADVVGDPQPAIRRTFPEDRSEAIRAGTAHRLLG